MFSFVVFVLALGYAALFVGWMLLVGKLSAANRYFAWVQSYHEYVVTMLVTGRVVRMEEYEVPEERLH
jgi:hypothetical protein